MCECFETFSKTKFGIIKQKKLIAIISTIPEENYLKCAKMSDNSWDERNLKRAFDKIFGLGPKTTQNWLNCPGGGCLQVLQLQLIVRPWNIESSQCNSFLLSIFRPFQTHINFARKLFFVLLKSKNLPLFGWGSFVSGRPLNNTIQKEWLLQGWRTLCCDELWWESDGLGKFCAQIWGRDKG